MRQKQAAEDNIVFESFKYRAQGLRGWLRICDWCLLRRRRCMDSHRTYCKKSWKHYRRTQWKASARSAE